MLLHDILVAENVVIGKCQLRYLRDTRGERQYFCITCSEPVGRHVTPDPWAGSDPLVCNATEMHLKDSLLANVSTTHYTANGFYLDHISILYLTLTTPSNRSNAPSRHEYIYVQHDHHDEKSVCKRSQHVPNAQSGISLIFTSAVSIVADVVCAFAVLIPGPEDQTSRQTLVGVVRHLGSVICLARSDARGGEVVTIVRIERLFDVLCGYEDTWLLSMV